MNRKISKKHLFYLLVLAGTTLSLISCNKEKKAQMPPPKVQMVKVLQTNVPVPVDFVGQTYGYRDIPIRARVDGFLTGMHFQEGSRVRRGQLLYSIDPEQYKAIEASNLSLVSEAKTMMVKAEADLNRIRPLAAINAVSQSDLDAAVAQYDAAKSQVDAAEAQLKYSRINLSYCSIFSPIDGIIGRTEAKTGEYVGKAPNPIVLNTVSSTDTILVNFSISEAEFLRLARMVIEKKEKVVEEDTPDTTKKDRISLILADGSVFEQPGRINFADREIDPSTGTILIQAAFSNPQGLLRPGQFARIKVIIDEIENGLLIPQRCVKELQGSYQVYTVNDSSQVEVRNVKLGPKIGGMWLVEGGLTADDAIVLEGLNLARPGTKVTPELVQIPQELIKF